ncbi:hypothetical protein XaplCFBP3122_03090 [Xanthomonas arboricola pv. populi]|uniref:Uncharacterized protein n=2 Tax=Xanthomonas arboricola TaxID=56448 RepID=A0A2S7A8B1_9XANT|nr:hypothetical protein XaplCFBP3122_03090 [Xanthomonas arboricola pv. populi]PPU04843.1 hypothetical protein XarjCFBP7645_21100 [Xanthomonas arboricola]
MFPQAKCCHYRCCAGKQPLSEDKIYAVLAAADDGSLQLIVPSRHSYSSSPLQQEVNLGHGRAHQCSFERCMADGTGGVRVGIGIGKDLKLCEAAVCRD